mmetsp:Transcript_62060/g.116040  ORF Transcript_62060/g.116040 Transcript_62060/m.116040 type:complete len:239 (-) Transcript_62060:27-743(-)
MSRELETVTLDNPKIRTLILAHVCATEEQCFDVLQLGPVSRWWRSQLSVRIEPLYGFALPATAHVAMHWGMFSERCILHTRTFRQPSEVMWSTDPDMDHGDFLGTSEGSKIQPYAAFQLWGDLMKRVRNWHDSQGHRCPSGQGLEEIRIHLGDGLQMEVFQPHADVKARFLREECRGELVEPFRELACTLMKEGREKSKGTAEDAKRLLDLCPHGTACPVQPLHRFQRPAREPECRKH